MRSANTPTIAVTMGDPAGIGPEVILKAAAALSRTRRCPRLVVIGDLNAMSLAAERLAGVPAPIVWDPRAPQLRLLSGIPVMQVGRLRSGALHPGRPTAAGGSASFDYVVAGAKLANAGEVDALVTAPISKEWWHRTGHRYPGHSELLAEIGRARNWRMMFAGGDLKIGLVTVHVGLAKVPAMLRVEAVRKTIDLLATHMRENEGVQQPRIGVLGFNPHSGENGLFGAEEARAIVPAIAAARRAGIDAFGPLAPDTAFIRQNGDFKFDAAVVMYHDQGLIALKTLEFDRAVNITLGIPFVRASPDHGTAFDIAGRGVASGSSMLAALEYAWRMARSRMRARAA